MDTVGKDSVSKSSFSILINSIWKKENLFVLVSTLFLLGALVCVFWFGWQRPFDKVIFTVFLVTLVIMSIVTVLIRSVSFAPAVTTAIVYVSVMVSSADLTDRNKVFFYLILIVALSSIILFVSLIATALWEVNRKYYSLFVLCLLAILSTFTFSSFSIPNGMTAFDKKSGQLVSSRGLFVPLQSRLEERYIFEEVESRLLFVSVSIPSGFDSNGWERYESKIEIRVMVRIKALNHKDYEKIMRTELKPISVVVPSEDVIPEFIERVILDQFFVSSKDIIIEMMNI